MFVGYFDPENVFWDNENEYFLGWHNRYVGFKKSNCSVRALLSVILVVMKIYVLGPGDLTDSASVLKIK